MRGSYTVLVSEESYFSARAVDLLTGDGAEVRLRDLSRGELLSAVGDVDVLWVRLRHRIDREVMDAAPRLRYIVTATTGLNHIDCDAAAERGIQVVSLRGEVDFLNEVHATAEHTVALMLSLMRSIPSAVDHVKRGEWNRDLFRGRELHGKTVGIVGYGRLGRIVARFLGPFGVKVLAADPNLNDNWADPEVRLVELPELLSSADIVSLHVCLDASTTGFFGMEQFAGMKPGAFFINTSRGELIDEAALLSCLRTSHLAGAALDVLAGERSDGMGASPLVAYARENRNLIITPHIGGCTSESMEKTEDFLATRLIAASQAGRAGTPCGATIVS